MDAVKASTAPSIDDLASALSKFGISKVPQIPNTFPTLNQIDVYRSHIAELLSPIVNVDTKVCYNAIQWTTTLENGDLVLPSPALRLKGRKPDELAAFIVENFPESELVDKPQIVPKGFVKWYFKPLPLIQMVLPSILKSGDTYGFNPNMGWKDASDESKGRKKIIVEFSSPNIAKPFHAGHLRSTIIGGFLSNLHEAQGYDVTRMNYLGDWGKQYGVLAVGFSSFGDEKKLAENAIGHLYEVYVKISALQREQEEDFKARKEEIAKMQTENKTEDVKTLQEKLDKDVYDGVDEQARRYFKKMTEDDPEALATWKRFRDLSIEKYKATYARLNIRYDVYSGESQIKEESMQKASKIMEEKKVSEDSQGAVIVDLTRWNKKLGKAVSRNHKVTRLTHSRLSRKRMELHSTSREILEPCLRDGIHIILTKCSMLWQVSKNCIWHSCSRLSTLWDSRKLLPNANTSPLEWFLECQHERVSVFASRNIHANWIGTARFLGMCFVNYAEVQLTIIDDILADVGAKMHEVMKSNPDKYALVSEPEKVADILGISSVIVQVGRSTLGQLC
jgi:arginyl-tRNA synthetase